MHSLTAELHMGAFHNLVNVTFFEALPDIPSSLALLLRYTRSRLISKASLFCARSTFAILSVGMSISAGITASVQYVNENEVSLLLDFIMTAVCSFYQAIGLRMFKRSKVLVDT
ncbi:hypothetical protein Tco_0570574 [Tanacetum coccineum]